MFSPIIRLLHLWAFKSLSRLSSRLEHLQAPLLRTPRRLGTLNCCSLHVHKQKSWVRTQAVHWSEPYLSNSWPCASSDFFTSREVTIHVPRASVDKLESEVQCLISLWQSTTAVTQRYLHRLEWWAHRKVNLCSSFRRALWIEGLVTRHSTMSPFPLHSGAPTPIRAGRTSILILKNCPFLFMSMYKATVVGLNRLLQQTFSCFRQELREWKQKWIFFIYSHCFGYLVHVAKSFTISFH